MISIIRLLVVEHDKVMVPNWVHREIGCMAKVISNEVIRGIESFSRNACPQRAMTKMRSRIRTKISTPIQQLEAVSV